MSDQRVRMKDIAEAAGVSTVAVSKALAGYSGVSESMRARIVALAKEMGYEPVAERRKRKRTSFNIGVLVPEGYLVSKEKFYSLLLQHLTEEAGRCSSNVTTEIIGPQMEKECSVPMVVREDNMDGLVLLGSFLMGLLYCFLTVTLRANQNVTGLALTTFGIGFGNFFGGSLIKLTGSSVPSIALSATNKAFAAKLPLAEKTGVFGRIFLSYGFLAYLAIVIALVTSHILTRTRVGLQLRAVGENPATADAAGINVGRYKYLATCIGSMIAGLGGLYYVMDYASGVWSNDAFGDRGWLAIALVIFTIWRPNVGILASMLFGGLYILYLFIPTGTNLAIKEIYKMLPYLVTIAVLVLISLRKRREDQPPAGLGLPYFREER